MAQAEPGRGGGRHRGATARIIEVARGIRADELPDDVRYVARHCFLDWFGVALAGSREPLARILFDEVRELGGAPQAGLVGHTERSSVLLAALLNGAASHALDYDDTHMAIVGHPSVPVIPALLAQGELEGSSGLDVMTAFVAGVEVECFLGRLLGREHYQHGYHATATIGSLGAAAACAHLLDLDAQQWAYALGTAATQAGGLKSVFGTMGKPFHAGRAASNGLLAARLARRGFDSHPAVLEAPLGFAQVLAPGADATRDVEVRPFAVRQTLFKYHAACYLTHASIVAMTELRDAHGLSAEDVSAIEARVPPGHLDVCDIQEPATGLEAKFSLSAVLPMVLLGEDTSQPDAYTAELMARPELVRLRDATRTVPDASEPAAGSTVTVRTRDGRELVASADAGRPAEDLDRQWERLGSKFTALAEPIIGAERSRELHARIAQLDKLASMSELLELCHPA
ncbi:MAG: MmgE/PrpD family protein [Myxococcota bacterium]